MPHLVPPRPRAATCEDWDEDNDDVLPDTRTSADVAIKRAQPELKAKASYERRRNDGSDSGYSSKAGTIDSDLSGSRRMTGLTIKTGVAERERQPYASSQSRPEVHRQSSVRPHDPIDDRQPSKARHFKHEKGICGVCDYYGWHVPPSDDPRPRASRPPIPASPQKARTTAPTTPAEDPAMPPVMRRTSSTRGSRPTSMYAHVPSQYQYATVPVHHAVYTPQSSTPMGWSTTPISPSIPYTPIYTYSSVPVVGSQDAYREQPLSYDYFVPSTTTVPELRPPNPKRRSATYEKPVIKHASADPDPKQTENLLDFDPRSQRSSQDRDHVVMGPPPRPEPRAAEVVIPRRPSLRKTTTYTPTSSSHRRSVTLEPEQLPPLPPTPTNRERRTSPSRPPTSYRGPHSSDLERPHLPKKAQSYSTATHTSQIAASDRPSQSVTAGVPRRTTMPSSLPRERHEDEAEAYQHDPRSLTSNDWMEAVRKNVVPTRDVSERSETGSSKSHKSHRSGSRASSGGGTKAAQTVLKVGDATITTNGHVTVDRGGNIKIDTKGGGGMTLDGGNGQRKVERAPSVASRASRVSAHSGSVASNGAGKAREEASLGRSRRSSRPTESYPEHVRAQLSESFTPRTDGKYSADDLERERNGGRRRSQSHARTHSRPASVMGRSSIDQGGRRGSERDERGVSDFY